MRKLLLYVLLLAFTLFSRPASADPLRITSGTFALDIEGDIFTFSGAGFSLTTTEFFNYATKLFPGRCDPSSSQFGFCAEAEGALADWSFHTTGGEQLLGTGNVLLDGVSAKNVDFRGSMRFDVVPTPVTSGGTLDFDFVAPFTFEAMIRGVQGGEQLFARRFTGRGEVSVNYEGTQRPGVFSAADETIVYTFEPVREPAPVPEPATLFLLGSGVACAVLRRSRSGRVRTSAARESDRAGDSPAPSLKSVPTAE